MKRLSFLLAALLGTTASAAEITRVASSFEEKDPFGMFLDFTFDRTADRGTITREWYQLGELQDVTELRYQKYDSRLGIDVNLGIYKDFELHVGVPIVFQQDRTWKFAGGTNETNTTISRNCSLDPQGSQCANPGSGEGQLFTLPGYPDGTNSYRSGLGDFTFGLAWNPFVQKKDPSKPTWSLRFDYTAPTAALLNPSVATSSANRGNIGDKLHRYAFSTAVSKRISKYVEPYFEVHYTLAWRGPGFYSNCDDASADRQGRPENCGKPGWERSETGVKPVHTGGSIFGVEITAFEREERHQRVAFDFRGFVNYFSEGRYYNEMSDLFGKLLYTSDYGQMGGQFGFVGQAAEFVILKANVSFAYNSEHFLTNENIGKDLTGNGTVDVTSNPEEINPNFDERIDRVGRRFRLEQQFIFRLQVSATFNF
ncbi:MAG: hypothetical protein Q8N23_28135 [Archangium sp.]|nr:hypothetical protein [Archangium sp.]MDP3576325.1 hypothetical protein [Archangium sp.]